jgi:hypothetical protein
MMIYRVAKNKDSTKQKSPRKNDVTSTLQWNRDERNKRSRAEGSVAASDPRALGAGMVMLIGVVLDRLDARFIHSVRRPSPRSLDAWSAMSSPVKSTTS